MAADPLLASAIAFLKRHPPFDGMADDVLRDVAGALTLAYFPAGSVLIAPEAGMPDHLFIVQRGLVQLRPAEGYHVSGGAVVTLAPGECFSVYALMEKRAVASPYTAAQDTFCYRLPLAAFEALLQRSARFREFCTDYLRSLLRDSRRLLQLHAASAAAEEQTMNRPLRVLACRHPVACGPATGIRDALTRMHEARIGSIVVVDDAHRPIGIFTRHDVLDRVALAGKPLDEAIAGVMTHDPLTLDGEATAHDAALLIARHGVRHVPVVMQGRLCGVITERDLFAVQRATLHGVNRAITQAHDVAALEQAGRDIAALTRRLHAQGVAAGPLTQLITTLNDALTQRVIDVTAQKHGVNGLQDVRWCWLAFGSEGRSEQTISTDQDNGLIFECGADVAEAAVRSRLLAFAQAVNETLARCGFPLCEGGIMAGNPRWCLTFAQWQRQFDDWVRNTDPEALLHSAIFFDFRALHGEALLAERLREALHRLVHGNTRFLRELARYALETKPPLGVISDFTTERDADGAEFIDLKKSAARLFVDTARVFALAAEVPATHTAARLRGAAGALALNEVEVNGAIDGFQFVQQLRLRAQLAATEGARRAANCVDPATLGEIDRRILKESLRQARRLQSRLALDYAL
jgi:CBS domain-containing protein